MHPAFETRFPMRTAMKLRSNTTATALLPGLATLLLAAAAAVAQDAYPSKPITMIVPFPPGGVADLTGRPTAASMEKVLKQKIVVENKAGAGGGIGMAQVAKSKPDGYT